jgi:FAD binding domain
MWVYRRSRASKRTCPTRGSAADVAGLTLHGGTGHLRRKHGLSIDNLLSVDLVTADGELRRASATENEDLFWAVRGAGSNFGVVTSFEFQAHPVGPMVMVGAVFYPLDEIQSVLPAWRDFVSSAPNALSSIALCWSVPPHEPFPPEHHGKPVLLVAGGYAGPVEEGEAVVQPLRELGEPLIDLSGPWPWLGLQSGFDALFPKGGFYYWKSRALSELTGAAIDDIADFAGRRPSPLTDIVVWHNGGAISDVGETDTAYGGREAEFLVTGQASWDDPAETDDAIGWAETSGTRWDAIRPEASTSTSPARGRERSPGQGGLRRELRAARPAQGEIRSDELLPDEPEHRTRRLAATGSIGPKAVQTACPRRGGTGSCPPASRRSPWWTPCRGRPRAPDR